MAKPVLEADSHAKGKLRRTIRNAARAPAQLPEAQTQEARCPAAQAEAVAREAGLNYGTAVRGILTRLAGYGDSSTLMSDTPAMVQQ